MLSNNYSCFLSNSNSVQMTLFCHLSLYTIRAQITLSSLLEDPHDWDPPPLDSNTMYFSSYSPSLDSNHAWPIALRKGIRHICHPYLIYNILSYYRLSPSYSSFVSPCSSLIFLTMFIRLLVTLDGDKPWLMKCMHLNIVIFGSLSLFLLVRSRWVGNGSMQLKLVILVK